MKQRISSWEEGILFYILSLFLTTIIHHTYDYTFLRILFSGLLLFFSALVIMHFFILPSFTFPVNSQLSFPFYIAFLFSFSSCSVFSSFFSIAFVSCSVSSAIFLLIILLLFLFYSCFFSIHPFIFLSFIPHIFL